MSSSPDVGRGNPQSMRYVIPTPALNQTHVFDDLMLFIDAQEKRMFEAIDGRRSISEILDKVKEKRTSPLLFKKLWWYDQVVFDTSKAK